MADATRNGKPKVYLGIDVGGTKIISAVISSKGDVLARKKLRTPRDQGPDAVIATILESANEAVDKAGVKKSRIRGVGLAVPGIVDDRAGLVRVAPNVPIAGIPLLPPVRKAFDAPAWLGNDVDLGTLGEAWLGAGKGCDSVVGIFPGTGVGGGLVLGHRLWRGHRGFAGEIGHMTLDYNTPDTNWITPGSLEALASRTAIERKLRAAIDAGEQTILPQLLEGDLSRIRSGALARALKEEDALVTRVLRETAEILGHGCVSIRRVLDPQVIVLGGGVMEACGFFMMPLIHNVLRADPLNPDGDSNARQSTLGDDATTLGAVALVRHELRMRKLGQA